MGGSGAVAKNLNECQTGGHSIAQVQPNIDVRTPLRYNRCEMAARYVVFAVAAAFVLVVVVIVALIGAGPSGGSDRIEEPDCEWFCYGPVPTPSN